LKVWIWKFDNFCLGSRSWHFRGSSVTILWNIIPIHKLSEKIWLRQCKTPLYVYSDLNFWPWIKVMTLSWVQCNISVKYYSNSKTHWKVMAQINYLPMS
jgi:hypothetical protein